MLQRVFHWLVNNDKPSQIDPIIASNSFLLVYYKLFNQLCIIHETKIIHIDYPNLHDSNPSQRDKICSPFTLFHAAFNKLHAHGHSGIKRSIKAFNQLYFIPYLNKWMSIFIHDCIECQQNKHNNQKIQTASIQTISENPSYFNYRISMDTKGPINPPSNQNSDIHVIVDAFSHFVVLVPIKQNKAQNAVNSLLHHSITKFGPPVYLVTDRGSEDINSEFANLFTTMGIRHSPRTPYSPWTNGLVENQNRNFGTHLRLFLHNTPENWSTQVHMYAYAHNSQPLSELNLSPYEKVFHTIPRIPINFELNLQRDTYRNCTSQYCQELPLHTHYDKSNLNPFFHKILSKPIPQWILATETAIMQIYHTVYENTKGNFNSMAYFNKTYNNPRSLDIGTFVLKRNFLHIHFSEKLKPLRIGPFKIMNKFSDITYEIVNQDGYTSHIHRNHLVPYYPKEPIIFLFLQQNNPHSIDNKYNDSDLNAPLQSYLMKNNQLTTTSPHIQILIKKRLYHPQLIPNQNHLVNILHFRTNKKHQKLITLRQKIKLISTITIILLIPEDTPIIDTISVHNHEKTIDFSSVKRIYCHLLKNPAERKKLLISKPNVEGKKVLKLNVKVNKETIQNKNKIGNE